MSGYCPHLGLDGDRKQIHSIASPRHRCYAQGQAERIGAKHQAMTCLRSSAFRRCPRLVAGAVDSAVQPGDSRAQQPAPAPPATSSQDSVIQMEQAAPVRSETPQTELSAARRRPRTTPRRSRTAIEFAVFGLSLAIILAFSFISYAVVYRLRVGPGLASAVTAAPAPESSLVELSPTLVPTFTPTPTPTLLAPTPVAELPTPLPEPALPVLAQPTRPVASSPPTRLVIPKIDVDIPVLTVGVKILEQAGRTTAVWADVPNAGGFHQTSALPGQPGNTVINGHRDIAGSVFRRLDRVNVGDEIVLYVHDVPFPYRVTETLVVPQTFASAKQRAENQRLIGYMPEERLTLVTCTPVGLATHRLLVIARPPDQAGPDMPEAGSDTQP